MVTDVIQGGLGRFFANHDRLLDGYYITPIGDDQGVEYVLFVVSVE